MASLRTPVWLLRGISSIPGVLALQGSSLSFVATDTGSAWPRQLRTLEHDVGAPGFAAAVESGASSLLFRWPTTEVRVWVPWYYFGGGLKIARGRSVLRFSFGRPANLRGSHLDAASEQIQEVRRMRARGDEWIAALRAADH